jgi:uncharacterized GH25 family protein
MSNSRSTTTWILLLLLAGVIGVGAWLALAAGESEQPELRIAGATPVAAAPAVAAAPISAPEPVPTQEPVRAAALDGTVGDLVPEQSELADSIWVEGRVVVPAGTPADESIELYASGRSFKKAKGHRVRIGSDGRFRIAFAKGSKNGTLKLEARYLFLREPLKLEFEALTGPLELAPELGGVIRGAIELVNPTPELRARIPGLYVTARSNQVAAQPQMQRAAKIDASLNYELRAVPTDIAPTLEFDPAFLVPVREVTVALKPGEVTVQNLKGDPGATLRARVVDEQGQPLAKVRVALRPDYERLMARNIAFFNREQVSAADGTFTVEGLPPALARLTCQVVGFKVLERSLDVAKEDVSNLALTLERGLSIDGVVRWPDGTPAAEARVQWHVGEDSDVYDLGGPGQQGVEADAQGRYIVSGLEDKSYTLKASATRKVDAAAIAGASDKSKLKRKETLKGRVAEVRAGSRGVELALGSGLAVSGIAVDDLGTPLESFSIRARKHIDDSWTNEGAARHFKNGTFELEGLHEGQWKIAVVAAKHADSEELLIELPGPSSGLRLVAPRVGRIAGRVVDAQGAPVFGAIVRWSDEQDADWSPWNNSDTDSAKTKADGTFVIASARPGSGWIEAQSREGARSPRLEIALVPGADRTEIELRLVGLGEIHGTLDGSVALRDKRRISLEEMREQQRFRYQDADRSTLTDELGNFQFVLVPAGKWRVVLEPADEVGVEDATANVSMDWAAREALRSKRQVELAQGELVEVVLGGPDEGPIRLHGRVSSGGRPKEGVRITAQSSGGHETQRTTRSGAAGDYELRLPEAGTYTISCTTGASGTQRTTSETFADGADALLDFELYDGRLEGSLIGPDDKPVGNCWISLQLASGGKQHANFATHGTIQTSHEGLFVFADLPPGSYTIEANRWGMRAEEYAQQKFGPFEVGENEHESGLELRLERAGRLTIRIRTAPAAAQESGQIVLWDEQSHTQDASWMDSDGTHLLHPRPGRYQVFACTQSSCSEWRSVEIVEGQRAEVELTLDCTADLAVQVLDSKGERVPCRIQALDERGADLSLLHRWNHEQDGPGHVVFSPVPPGGYTIVASNNDGEIGRKQVSVGTSGAASVRIDKP